jgi:hypothetical protein
MDYQLILGMLALAVAVYSAFLQRQALIMTASKREESAILQRWWRSPSIVALVLLTVLAWTPWAVTAWKNWGIERVGIGVIGWGQIPQDANLLEIALVGTEIKPAYKLIGIATHYRGSTDIMDWSPLEISAPYDFRLGQQIVIIQPSQSFLNDVKAGAHNTQYFLLMIPANIKTTQFKTLREAVALGGKFLWSGNGPP